MTPFLQIENLTKSFGDHILFADVTFGLNEGDKVGLIAKNGTGKTTLLRIIAGLEDYDSGSVIFRNDLRIAYLEQTPQFQQGKSVLDICLDSDDDPRAKAVKQYEQALDSGDPHQIALASDAMDEAHAWDFEDFVKTILSRLNISHTARLIDNLSGGETKRLALAKLLIGEPQLVILDEPTNHLDVDMIEWFEDYLSRSRITILMVTHDRYFLDRVCNKIIEIDQQQAYSYAGNYNYYLEKRAERHEAQAAEMDRAKNLFRTELDWMRRQPQARAGKAKYRIDAFYELEKKINSQYREKQLDINIKSSYIGSKIFVAEHVSKAFGSKVIVRDFNYNFARYEKLGIVGANGVGKSSFIKLLLGILSPDSGRFDIGQTVRFGYYSQQGIEFNEKQKVIDIVREIAEHVTFDEKTHYSASQFLNLFLFSAADQQKYVAKLSGGERRRLYLATVLMRKPNFLILDEPTNDLDICTLEVLEDYIEHFHGCVIIISHDRFFMDRSVDHILVFHGDGEIQDFPGNYSQYRLWKTEHDRIAAEQAKAAAPAQQKQSYKADSSQKNANKLTFKEKKEFEALTAELDALNKEKAELDALFNSGEQISDVAEKAARYNDLIGIIDEKEMRWLELSEKE